MKIIKTGHEARVALKRGVDIVADAVKVTLGPSGRNAIIGRPYMSPMIINDGVTIAREIQLEDEIERLGAEKVQEVSKATDDRAGDGTTTSTVILQAILNEGFKRLDDNNSLIKKNSDPMKIRAEIEVASEKVLSELKRTAKPIKTKEEIFKVANISVESEPIAEIIATIFDKVGKDGVVTVEEGDFEIEHSIVDGMEIESGYFSPHLATNDRLEAVIEKPIILVTNHRIERPEPLLPLFEKVQKSGITRMVIISDLIEKPMHQIFVLNKVRADNPFFVLAIKAPTFGKYEILEDYAALFNARFIDKEKGMKLEDVSLEDLGKADKIVANKDTTLVLGSKGKTKDRVAQLRTEMKTFKSEFDRKQMSKRIAKISGGVGLIKVGAVSDTEKEYLRLKIEDAVNATKAALEEGVVKGGGVALFEIAEKLPKSILTEALKAPYNQIQENAGGYLLVKDDVIDPVKVTINAVRNACSIAGLLITTEVAINDKNDDKHKEHSSEN